VVNQVDLEGVLVLVVEVDNISLLTVLLLVLDWVVDQSEVLLEQQVY
jgi:hypothetical protein